MGKTVVSRGFLGLRTNVDPASLGKDEKGLVLLSTCSNVDIDNSFRLSLRRGYQPFYTQSLGVCRNCFSTPNLDFAVFTEGNALSIIDLNDMSISRIRMITPGLKFVFDLVGDKIYYTNGVEQGLIDIPARTTRSWVIDTEYHGPKTSLIFSPPPLGTRLYFYNGRMYIIVGSTIFYSQPFDVHRYVLDENSITLPTKISLITSAESAECLVVSDQKNIYCLRGGEVKEFNIDPVYNAPAIAGTEQSIHPNSLGLDGVSTGIILTTTKGVIFISNLGEVTELTEDKIDIPKVSSLEGTSAIFNGKYICQFDVII